MSSRQRPLARNNTEIEDKPTTCENVASHDACSLCRFCEQPLRIIFADLGSAPASNAYRTRGQLFKMEPFYPLCVYVCESCYLVQLPEHIAPAEIFDSDYAYFSSYSATWLASAERYVAAILPKLRLDESSQVIEIASNDGYLLQYFLPYKIPVLGVEPAASVAKAAISKGVPTIQEFFGLDLARNLASAGMRADLVIANNVLAHTPDLNGFVAGLKIILKQNGLATIEVPHLLQLIRQLQFDTIYHEHFSYFSLLTLQRLFSHHGLCIFDIEELPTHGGSLRIYVSHDKIGRKPSDAVNQVRQAELAYGLDVISRYSGFNERIQACKCDLVEFLITVKREGKRVCAYGAAAKGNTLLNYCGIRTEFIDYVVDRNPHKQGKHLPGSRIPIEAPERIRESRPEYILILPWNLKDEIVAEISFARAWGAKFVTAIPSVQVTG
jgi:SAM-dependent methyltransferase